MFVGWMNKCTNQHMSNNNHTELWAEVLESRNWLFFHLLHPAQSLAHRKRSGNVDKQVNALCKGLDPGWIQLHPDGHKKKPYWRTALVVSIMCQRQKSALTQAGKKHWPGKQGPRFPIPVQLSDLGQVISPTWAIVFLSVKWSIWE